jgi:nucleotide-binding universal stress UspA family protein
METTILAGLAFEHDEALELGRALAGALAARLVLGHVVSASEANPSAAVAAARSWLERAARRCDREATPAVLAAESTAVGLRRLAVRHDAQLLALGPWRGAPRGHVGVGRVAERVLPTAPCPVGLAPQGYEARPLRTVAVAYDGTPASHLARRFGHALADAAGADLRQWTAVHQPVMEIARAAAQGDVDLVVCGSRGRGPLRSLLLGSVSEQVASRVSCPIVIVPASARRPPEPAPPTDAVAGR